MWDSFLFPYRQGSWGGEVKWFADSPKVGQGMEKSWSIFGSTDLATSPSPKSTWNVLVEYHPSEASDGLLWLQNALALVCICVCARRGGGAVCSLHRPHMWLIPPHVLCCCFPILYSSRSFLVPNPHLPTSGSGNSFFFLLQSTGEEKCLICSLGVGVPHSSLNFFLLHRGILGSYPCPRLFQSRSFSAPSQGLWMCVCSSHTFSFCLEGESFRVSAAGRAELWWGYCYAGRC